MPNQPQNLAAGSTEVPRAQVFDLNAHVRRLPPKPKAKGEEQNPFVAGMTIKTKKRRSTVEGKTFTDEDGREHDAETNLVEFLDTAPFIKLFTEDLTPFLTLSHNGFKLLILIVSELAKSPGKDEIYLHANTVTDVETGAEILSRSAFYRAIPDLAQHGFIAKQKTRPHMFFVNPNLVFNGDRVKFANTYIRKHAHLSDEDKPKVLKNTAKTTQQKAA
ncbi:hypothetical protein [Paraburkholderia sp. BCC1885]|uniref:hypothetical protein n=1 Tax=Paraburkholderia sp. BCC1885 TaxID=2562669 RepID=UPI00118249C4|nr:hypothetical protein [Paraburkholderia sp. BCC1885]